MVDLDHAFLIVGYGRDENSKTDYWICKNQWGTEWGMNGYINIKIGENICGIATDAHYIRV